MAQRRPGRLLTTLGVLLILLGLIGAVLLVLAGGERRSNAVAGFARAPVGCDTTLDFAEPGDYYVFVERSGVISGVRGDCNADETYDVNDGVEAQIVVVDPDGSVVDLDRPLDEVTYDVDGFAGEAVSVLDIAQAGDHVMRVESPDGQFVVAVGPDPSAGVSSLYAGAVIAAVLGLLVGGAFFFAGRRRGRVVSPGVQVAPTPPPFAPVGHAPQGPPTYTQPGGPIAYGQPQPQPPPAPSWQAGAPQPPSAPPSWQPTPPQPGPPQPGPPQHPAAPPWQQAPAAPGLPTPPDQQPRPPAPPPPWAPAAPSVPQIPGEPSWVAPGEQPPPPMAVPVPPNADERPDLWSDAPVATPEPLDDATVRLDPITRLPIESDENRGDPTVDRPAWRDAPPPPD